MTIRDSAKQSSRRDAASALSKIAVVVVAAYIAAQMVADIASLKIGVVAGLAVDMGTFVYPITFTLRDLVHKTLGKRNAQLLIVTAAIINLAMVLYLMWSAAVPGDLDSFGGAEFSMIFAPLWRIVCASILAELVSELVDTEIYHLFVSRVTTRFQWLRVLVSNSVSVPVDNLIFVLIAFSPFRLSGRATGRLLDGGLGDLRLQSAGQIRGYAGEYAADLSDAGPGLEGRGGVVMRGILSATSGHSSLLPIAEL